MSLKILLSENFVSLARVNFERSEKKLTSDFFNQSHKSCEKKIADGIFCAFHQTSVLVASSALRRVKEFPKLIGYICICIKHTLAHSCKHAHLRALAVYIIATDNIFEQKQNVYSDMFIQCNKKVLHSPPLDFSATFFLRCLCIVFSLKLFTDFTFNVRYKHCI